MLRLGFGCSGPQPLVPDPLVLPMLRRSLSRKSLTLLLALAPALTAQSFVVDGKGLTIVGEVIGSASASIVAPAGLPAFLASAATHCRAAVCRRRGWLFELVRLDELRFVRPAAPELVLRPRWARVIPGTRATTGS